MASVVTSDTFVNSWLTGSRVSGLVTRQPDDVDVVKLAGKLIPFVGGVDIMFWLFGDV